MLCGFVCFLAIAITLISQVSFKWRLTFKRSLPHNLFLEYRSKPHCVIKWNKNICLLLNCHAYLANYWNFKVMGLFACNKSLLHCCQMYHCLHISHSPVKRCDWKSAIKSVWRWLEFTVKRQPKGNQNFLLLTCLNPLFSIDFQVRGYKIF